MSEKVYECKICGRSFSRLSNMSRHIIMSKDHPDIEEYSEKYSISDRLRRKCKETNIEKDIELLKDDSKKTYVVRHDTPLVHVADMGLANTHSLVAINSEECNLDFLRLLMVIFARTNVHLCIMGPTASEFKDKIPEGLTTSLLIDSVAFNYSLAINILLKPIYEKFPMAKIAICDGWTIFSSIQVIKKEMIDVDWDNEFVSISTVFDYKEDPINLNMEPARLSSSVLRRLKDMRDLKYHIPIIICRAKYLLDLESGLEEDLFTEFSRSHLRNQLVTAGLIEKVCEKNKGLFIRPRILSNKTERVDIDLIERIAPRMNNFVFIPSNYDIENGDSNRIKQIVVKKKIPQWDHLKYKPSLTKIYNVNKHKNIQKEETLEPELVLTDFSKLLNPKHKILLMVNSNIRDLIGITPLIRGLYEKFGEVDILTKDKLNPAVAIIHSYMVRKIYDMKDYKNKFFSLKSYGPNIMSTLECSFNPKCDISIIKPVNVYNDISETNYSIIDPYILSMPKPFCNSKHIKGVSSSIIVAMSVSVDFRTDTKIWDCLDIISSRVGNNKNISICLISLDGERSLIKAPERYKLRKNFKIIENLNPIKAASIIKNSELFLASSDTQLSWLGYGLTINMILLDIDGDIPNSEQITRHCVKREDTIDIDNVVTLIWRNL